LIYLVL